MSASDWAQRARLDAERYARENPSWRDKAAKQPRREWTTAELARFAELATETREEFWARREAEGTTYGLKPRPPLKRSKRGPSKETLALKARIAELEALLAETRPLETRRVVASW